MSTEQQFILEGLPCMEPGLLLEVPQREWPEGLASVTIRSARPGGAGAAEEATLAGTREAIVAFVLEHWFDATTEADADPESFGAYIAAIREVPVGRYEIGWHGDDIHHCHVSFVLSAEEAPPGGASDDLFDIALYHIDEGEDDGAYVESLEALRLAVHRANAGIGAAEPVPVGAAVPDELARTIRAALEGDSNDAEHDALVEVAQHFGVAYIAGGEEDGDEDLVAILRAAAEQGGEVRHWDVKAELGNGLEVAVWFTSGEFRYYSCTDGVVKEDESERVPAEPVPVAADEDEAGGVHGRCDTCGAPCDAEGCTADRAHIAAVSSAVAQVVAVMPDEGIIGDDELTSLLQKEYGWGAEAVGRSVGQAHVENAIRWVAYRGWAKGGRPS